jgi:bacillopeptidase F
VGSSLFLGVVMLTVGGGFLGNIVGQLGGAFNNAIGAMGSQPPATMGPSGVAMTTPVIDEPPDDGYTNQKDLTLTGSVPGAAVGKDGFTVRVYILGQDNSRLKVAEVAVGTTTRFVAPGLTLTEGTTTFIATLVSPSSEGDASPEAVYILDTKPPAITVTSPSPNSMQTTTSVDVVGRTEAGATITVRNSQAPGGSRASQITGGDGRFRITVALVAGSNPIELTATDRAGNTTTKNFTVKRDYGQLAAHLSVAPNRIDITVPTTLTLTLHATTENGSPLANARVTFTVTIAGLGPIVSPEMTTDGTGTATWTTEISGATPGSGNASVLVSTSSGDMVSASALITTY